MYALHRGAWDCLRELKEERAVLYRSLRKLEALDGMCFLCPGCGSRTEQTKAAHVDSAGLTRTYRCVGCASILVTVERADVETLHRAFLHPRAAIKRHWEHWRGVVERAYRSEEEEDPGPSLETAPD